VLGDKGYSSLGGIGGMVRLWQAAAFPSRGPMGGELQMDDIKCQRHLNSDPLAALEF
jgi:hypothetical protein